MATDQQK